MEPNKLHKDQVVTEVNMSPTALEKFAQSEDAARLVVGAEFEYTLRVSWGPVQHQTKLGTQS